MGGIEDTIREALRAVLREELASFKAGQAEGDRLLTAAQAAELLQVSARWLYRHADELPYGVRLSPTVVRFSYNRIQQEIRRKLAAQQK